MQGSRNFVAFFLSILFPDEYIIPWQICMGVNYSIKGFTKINWKKSLGKDDN